MVSTMTTEPLLNDLMDEAGVDRARLDAPGGQAWLTFLRAHASLLRTLDRELQRDAQLSLSDYDVLIQLAMARGSMRMGDLARRTLVSRSGATRRVEQLERVGLVARRSAEQDRRLVTVALTEVGVVALRRATSVHAAGIARSFVDKLSDDELIALSDSLAKVVTECDFG